MAKRIVWASQAKIDRFQILIYWREHNKSNKYSRKLNLEFNKAIQSIKGYPLIGKRTNKQGIRVKIVNHFHLIMRFWRMK